MHVHRLKLYHSREEDGSGLALVEASPKPAANLQGGSAYMLERAVDVAAESGDAGVHLPAIHLCPILSQEDHNGL